MHKRLLFFLAITFLAPCMIIMTCAKAGEDRSETDNEEEFSPYIRLDELSDTAPAEIAAEEEEKAEDDLEKNTPETEKLIGKTIEEMSESERDAARYIWEDELFGSSFILKSFNGEPVKSPLPVTIEFSDNDEISGRICNTFSGQVEFATMMFKADQVATTRMMCPDEELARLENNFLRNLGYGIGYQLTGDELELRRDDMVLIFTRKKPGDDQEEDVPPPPPARKPVSQPAPVPQQQPVAPVEKPAAPAAPVVIQPAVPAPVPQPQVSAPAPTPEVSAPVPTPKPVAAVPAAVPAPAPKPAPVASPPAQPITPAPEKVIAPVVTPPVAMPSPVAVPDQEEEDAEEKGTEGDIEDLQSPVPLPPQLSVSIPEPLKPLDAEKLPEQSIKDDSALVDASQVTEKDLAGKKFVLAKVDGKQFMPDMGEQPFIQFDLGIQISGKACNNFRGKGSLVDNVLTMPNAASTMMMCGDAKLNQYESDFHRLLREGAEVTLEDGELTLTGDDREFVYYES